MPQLTRGKQKHLVNKMAAWIENNQPTVEVAQNLAKAVVEKNLLNTTRPLPFQIVQTGKTNAPKKFQVIVHLDHPIYGYWQVRVYSKDKIVFDPWTNIWFEKHMVKSEEEAMKYIAGLIDEQTAKFQELEGAIEKRDYSAISRLLADRLSVYRAEVDPALEEIKTYFSGIENAGVMSPVDGSVALLSRIIGRWTLALLRDPCPFVVVGDAEKTTEVRNKCLQFFKTELKAGSWLQAAQIAICSNDMQLEVITDSPEKAADRSAFVEIDKRSGNVTVRPLIHAQAVIVHSPLAIIGASDKFYSAGASKGGIILAR